MRGGADSIEMGGIADAMLVGGPDAVTARMRDGTCHIGVRGRRPAEEDSHAKSCG